MKIIYLVSFCTLLFLVSCSKSSSNSITLKLQSFSPNVLPVGVGAQVNFSFSDKGHLLDTLVILKKRINQDAALVATIRDTIYYPVPTYPQTTNGQLQVNLDYSNDLQSAINPPQIGNPPANESDSLIIRFVVMDNGHNVSDTVSAGLVVVQR